MMGIWSSFLHKESSSWLNDDDDHRYNNNDDDELNFRTTKYVYIANETCEKMVHMILFDILDYIIIIWFRFVMLKLIYIP